MQKKGPPVTGPIVSLTNRALVSFIAEENYGGLQHVLESRKVVVDDRDESGATALMIASQRGQLSFVRALVEHGADVNAEDQDYWTPLLFAAKEGHDDAALYLLDHGALVDHRDIGGWTPLMWASYKGRIRTAHGLIEKGANVNAYGNFNITCLAWASGRNHVEVVKLLLEHGAKVNAGDKYGTTPLIWASRKGNLEIVELLLSMDANVDVCGMKSWTALLIATEGDHVDVVKTLLEHKPNVNALDQDGCSPLTIACKEGFHEIAIALINAGAYININDRGGSSNLVHAAKGGYRSIVDALLKKHADVNVQGKDRKTALYWAVEKSHVGVVKSILAANPDLELATKDGDTALMRATRNRNVEIVSLLLEKKAKVNATDKSGDTCLHIAMRSRSKQIVEVLLRNPVNSQLLYRPNRSGETPYNIDKISAKPLIPQLFGARGLNTQEDFENLLGYNLYSSALADMLSDPTLNMPITVGLFARWGSGKSFLLGKLKEEMTAFARQWLNPLFTWSPLLFIIIVCLASIFGVVCGLSFWSWQVGLSFTLGLIFLIHAVLLVIWFFSQRSNKYDWAWPEKATSYLAANIESARLIFQVVFCHPSGPMSEESIKAQPINFYFTEQTKISSTAAGENSVVQMLGSLYDCIENDYGTFATRLFRAFRPRPVSAHAPWKWRKLCCIPYCIIVFLCFVCSLISIVVLALYVTDKHGLDATTLQILMYSCALFVGLLLVANLYTIGQVMKAIVHSHKRHLHKTVDKLHATKVEGLSHSLRSEVTLLTEMVQCLDSFSGRQSRMVVIVDGLDSGEQDKVLHVLDAVHILFSDNKAPFIILLAIDPHITSKAIEMNINPVLNDANVGGQDYLRNLVHLPFFLQNSALRKVKQVKMLESMMKTGHDNDNLTLSVRKGSVDSTFGMSLSLERYEQSGSKRVKRFGLKKNDSAASSLGNHINKVGTGPGDLKKMLLGDDYFSDVNPKSMRRLMNVIHITGRLLKAFNFDFNWQNLSTWVNVTEQWPYRLSWMVIYCEILQKDLDESTSLKIIFERIRPFVPTAKEVDPNAGLDRDENKLDTYLTVHKGSLLVSTLFIFLPFTISLDPQLRKDITEKYQPNEQIFKTPGTFKPVIQPPPPSPYLTPGFANNIRCRQTTRNQPQGNVAQSAYCQHAVNPTTPVSPHCPSMWPFQGATYNSSAVPKPKDNLFGEFKSVKLGTLSVDGVCDFLSCLPNIKGASADRYQEAIRKNNVTGRVLLCCDLSELKGVLCMTFGDWEIFKAAITALRESEISDVSPDGAEDSSLHPAVILETRESPHDGCSLRPNVLEKQVTMEDQMITGALELLNDEAKEDARKGESTNILHSGSPVEVDLAEPTHSHRKSRVVTDRNETDVLYVLSTSTNTTAELPDSPRLMRTLQTQRPHYSVVNESLPKPVSVPARMVSAFSQIQGSSTDNYHAKRSHSTATNPLKVITPQPSPGKKRSSFKRSSLTRSQMSAANLSAAVAVHFKSKEELVKYPGSPEKSSKKFSGFRIGGTSTSSDGSQEPLWPGTVIQQRKVLGASGGQEKVAPASPKRRIGKDEEPGSSRLPQTKSSIFTQPYDAPYPGTSTSGALRNFQLERYDTYLTTEESSEPAMYFHNEPRGRPWTQYRAPTPLPPFGTEEYYRVIKSSNPSPTTTNESELGSSLDELSSGENLFFPEPPELPESPFPRRIGLSTVSGPSSGGNLAFNAGTPFVHYTQVKSGSEKRRSSRETEGTVEQHSRLPRGVTVLKVGSHETLLQEIPEASRLTDEEHEHGKQQEQEIIENVVRFSDSLLRTRRSGQSHRGFTGVEEICYSEEGVDKPSTSSQTVSRRRLNLSDPALSARCGVNEDAYGT